MPKPFSEELGELTGFMYQVAQNYEIQNLNKKI